MIDFLNKVGQWHVAARQRSQRRQSFWNVPLIFLCFAAWLLVWFALFRVVWLVHVTLYPAHQLTDFWQSGVSFWSFVLSFLMLFSLMPGSIVLGLILANLALWLIPPARRTFEKEATGYPSTTFRHSMQKLFAFAIVTVPIGLIVAVSAACCLKSLK
jgi:hypothetical protein